jgi:hypothetical protein
MPKNSWSILIALSLAACGTGPLPEAESADPQGLLRACWYWYDADGDGFGGASRVRTPGCLQPPGYVRNPLDCDDASAAVHPGAFEVCNDADDDCDGDVDLYALDEQVWYRDADGDGFGRWALTQLDCDQPVGYAATYGDCADTNPSRNPGATETCNGADDDCDGHTDDNDPDTVGQTWWYEDLDGDGYGTPASAVLACASGGGAPTADDCDDADAGRSPGAAEVCSDGIDQDCDGRHLDRFRFGGVGPRGHDVVDEVLEPGVVEGHLERNPNQPALHHFDLLHEVQHHLPLPLERQRLELVLEHRRKPPELRQVPLQRLPQEVLPLHQRDLPLELLLLRGELRDLRAADRGVEAVADRGVVVLDAALEVGELLIEHARVRAVLPPDAVDPLADLLFELGERLGSHNRARRSLSTTPSSQCFGMGNDAHTDVPLFR